MSEHPFTRRPDEPRPAIKLPPDPCLSQEETDREAMRQDREVDYQLANVLRERAARGQLRVTKFNVFALVVILLALAACIWEAAQ